MLKQTHKQIDHKSQTHMDVHHVAAHLVAPFATFHYKYGSQSLEKLVKYTDNTKNKPTANNIKKCLCEPNHSYKWFDP